MVQDTATCLLESRDGFLWIGTREGLLRFDGARFDLFSRQNLPEFLHLEVSTLAEAPDGALWIGTSEPGLYRMHQGRLQTLGEAQGLPDRPIQRLLLSRQGVLWAAPTEGPLMRLEGERFLTLVCDATRLRIQGLDEGPDGTLWVGTRDAGLWRTHQGRLTLAALTSAEITTVACGSGGEVYVGTRSQGLLVYADGRLDSPAWSRTLPRRPVSSLLVDRSGSLWIGLEQAGLYRHTATGRLEAVAGTPGTPWTPVSLLEDRAGALWSGSEARGLRVLYDVAFHPVPAPGSEGPVLMVTQDRGGGLWSLLGDRTLARLQGGRQVRVPLPGVGPLSALWPRQAGGLWLGTRTGDVFAFDQGRAARIKAAESALADPVLSLYEDAGGSLWVARERQGLLQVLPGQPALHLPQAPQVVAFAGGGSAPFYLGSRTQGLGLREGGTLRWLGEAEGLGSRAVQALHLDPDGNLWIGTPDGLGLYRDGKVRRLSELGGALALDIHAILQDERDHLWLTTHRGVFRLDRGALLKALRHAVPLSILPFTSQDGLPSRETSDGAQPSAWLAQNGDLWIPTSRGLACLEGRQPFPPRQPLQLHLLGLSVDDQARPLEQALHLPAGSRRLEIQYTATALTGAEKVLYRYRLDGFDRGWNEVGARRHAVYTNLPPGRHRFTLQAWLPGEEAQRQEQTLWVEVDPFLHQRPLFRGVVVGVAVGFLGWLARLRVQQAEARNAVLQERNRMAREIHDHLAQGFTGVLLQLEAAEARLARMVGDPTPILTRLEHARNLASSSLQEARRSVMALRPRKPEGTDLLGALRLLADRLLTGTDIQVELAQSGTARPLGERLEEELLRMAQEALTNALRHGKARWVRITLEYEARKVRLGVSDDGRGFDPKAQAAGYGMRSIRESVRQLGGDIHVDSSPGFGSQITITLPIRRWRP